MSTVSVRAVREEDVPAVVALVRDVLAEFGLTFGDGSATDAELHDLPRSYEGRGAFWVAEKDARILGTCAAFRVAPSVYELRKMYLHADARGLGLGRLLFNETVEWVRAQGGTTIVLDTIHAMTRAIAFYEANGFVRDDAQIRGARCSRGYRLDL